MSKSEIVLIGAGGHANACIDVIEQHGQYQIAGLVGKQDEIDNLCNGYPVFATDDNLFELSKHYKYALIAVGQIRTPANRIKLYQQVIKYGFTLPVVISPNAYVSHRATIGSGSIVLHGAIINAGAIIGSNCIINSRALIEHNVTVDDHCHISTGSILNGGVSIGKGSFIGSGSVIREGLSLGEGCMIGMGLSVRHSLANQTRFIGDNS